MTLNSKTDRPVGEEGQSCHVEYDPTLFEPAQHDTDDEGAYKYIVVFNNFHPICVYLCDFFSWCHMFSCPHVESHLYEENNVRTEDATPDDDETRLFLNADGIVTFFY